MSMHAAFTVLTDPALFLHIVGFQCGLPYALLVFEPELYADEATEYPFDPRDAVGGASLLHHALLSANDRMVTMLFRLLQQPSYAAMSRFALDGLQERVCKRGSVRHLERLHQQQDVPTPWPSSLLCVTLFELENHYPILVPEEEAAFHADQKNKAQWLMEYHPEACTDRVQPCGVLISAHRHRDFLLQLLAANVVDMGAFVRHGSWSLDTQLLELLLANHPTVVTRELVDQCAAHGNLEAVEFLHDRASEFADELFTTATMDAAATRGHLDVVRFLHAHRTEGCTRRAIDNAALARHLDVVKFLYENRTEGFSNGTIELVARLACGCQGDLAMVEYLTERRPEAIQDPTLLRVNAAVTYVRSVWAKRAVASDDPVQALLAAVIQLTDVEGFKKVHEQKHPAGCTGAHNTRQHSLLCLAIEEQKDDFATYLVNNCEHVRPSIGYVALRVAGSDSRPLNLELLDLLLTNGPTGEEAERMRKNLLRRAAHDSNLPFVKALLERGVRCSEEILMEALYGELFEVPMYLMERYPELVTTAAMRQVVFLGQHEYVFKLRASHPHLWDSSVVDEILCGDNTPDYMTWELVRSLYERCSSMPLQDDTATLVWKKDQDDLLLFMWLVWQDPKLPRGLAAADRGHRLRLYSRLRALVPSLFADVPVTLPWCCQLRFLRQRVESGEITLANVERARSGATSPSVVCDMDTSA